VVRGQNKGMKGQKGGMTAFSKDDSLREWDEFLRNGWMNRMSPFGMGWNRSKGMTA